MYEHPYRVRVVAHPYSSARSCSSFFVVPAHVRCSNRRLVTCSICNTTHRKCNRGHCFFPLISIDRSKKNFLLERSVSFFRTRNVGVAPHLATSIFDACASFPLVANLHIIYRPTNKKHEWCVDISHCYTQLILIRIQPPSLISVF